MKRSTCKPGPNALEVLNMIATHRLCQLILLSSPDFQKVHSVHQSIDELFSPQNDLRMHREKESASYVERDRLSGLIRGPTLMVHQKSEKSQWLKIPEAKAAVQAEYDNLRAIRTWDESAVEEYSSVCKMLKWDARLTLV